MLRKTSFSCLIALWWLCAPAFATVTVTSLTPSVTSPQKVGASITWTAKATDTGSGPLTFQFLVGLTGGKPAIVIDFNAGTLSAGVWTSQPFVWVPTGIAGSYAISVVAKDFAANILATRTVHFTLNPLVTGTAPVVAATANPLVALFSAPPCAAGSSMRIAFQQSASAKVNTTNYVNCNASAALTFEVAGMYPSTTYNLYAQTNTGGAITNGPMLSFKTGALPTLPAGLAFPTFTVKTTGTEIANPMLLLGTVSFVGNVYPAVATDLTGRIMWYYYDPVPPYYTLLTRPVPHNQNFTYPTMLVIQDGAAWNPATTQQQFLRQIDLAGNVVKETNTGVIQQQLLKLGAADAGPCDSIPQPAPVGAACLGGFHHEAIQTLPNGGTAVLASIEKIFPPGTQGDTSGLPVDVIGDIIIVLNASWQVVWYWDTFESYGLDVNRAAILGETCIANEPGCPPVLLTGAGSGVSTVAKDWIHPNSLYYWPKDYAGGASGDIVWSSKDQDWVFKIDYHNGSGAKQILWTMGNGAPAPAFTFNNIFNDPYPWFSHQHDVGMENLGKGPMTIFDNGNTRVTTLESPGCMPYDCNSRGMALTLDETTLTVTPVLNADLGYYASADGSAQLLADGTYYFLPATVFLGLNYFSFALDLQPAGGTGGGTTTLSLEGPNGYRGWQMSNLYNPPAT